MKKQRFGAPIDRPSGLAPVNLVMLGGGQLCQMAALAGLPLNVHVVSLDPDPDCCARRACRRSWVSDFNNTLDLGQSVENASAVAVDIETVPSSALRIMMDKNPQLIVMPGIKALEASQSRLAEKKKALESHIRTPRFWGVEKKEDLRSHRTKGISYPCLLKTDRNGYDGKGQRKANTIEELEREFEALGNVPCIVEEFVQFDAEISVIVVRDRSGNMQAYKPFENIHHESILRHTIWPGRFSETVIKKATADAMVLARHLNAIGLLTVEMFVVGEEVLFNEIAPRPHNSGHITMKCAVTSQFEQICRIARGMPIGSCEPLLGGVMTNMIGDYDQMSQAVSAGWSPYIYGKDEARPGRKLGHVAIAFPLGSMRVVIGGDDGKDILALPKLVPNTIAVGEINGWPATMPVMTLTRGRLVALGK